MRQVERSHDDAHPAARSRHAHHLGKSAIGVALFENGDRKYAVERLVGERQRLGVARCEANEPIEAISLGKEGGFAQQKRVRVDRRDGGRTSQPPGQQAVE